MIAAQVLRALRMVGLEMPLASVHPAERVGTAAKRSLRFGFGGVLCHGQGLYLQLLEGERSAVNRLFARILLDTRHKDVELLHLQEVEHRRFAAWSMAHVELRADDPMILMRHPEFDPYSATGALAMKLVDELCASGHRIQLPGA